MRVTEGIDKMAHVGYSLGSRVAIDVLLTFFYFDVVFYSMYFRFCVEQNELAISVSISTWRQLCLCYKAANTTEYMECQAFCPIVRIESPHPKRMLLSPVGSKGWDTPACGGGGGGTQLRRRDRHSGTLCIIYCNATVTICTLVVF
jgi:hypothetical protein